MEKGPKAHYGPDPFGAPLVVIGEEAQGNPFMSSTKYSDGESGLLYYGYRLYSSSLGRWLNRDPAGQRGGDNLYGFVANGPVNTFDILGLFDTADDLPKGCELPCAVADQGKTLPFFADCEYSGGTFTGAGSLEQVGYASFSCYCQKENCTKICDKYTYTCGCCGVKFEPPSKAIGVWAYVLSGIDYDVLVSTTAPCKAFKWGPVSPDEAHPEPFWRDLCTQTCQSELSPPVAP